MSNGSAHWRSTSLTEISTCGGGSLKQSDKTGSGSGALQPSDPPADEGSMVARIVPPSETAVLVVDVQNDFVDDRGRVGRSGADMGPLQSAVGEINRLITAARRHGARVLYIAVEHGHKVD